MGNRWSWSGSASTPQSPTPRYQVVLPAGARAWELLYSGEVDTWDAVAARYGMDKFAFKCGMSNCDRESVCLQYIRATLQASKQNILIERFKRPSVCVPTSSCPGLTTFLSEGFSINEVVACQRGQYVVLVLPKCVSFVTLVAFPLVYLGNDAGNKKKDTDNHKILRRHSSKKNRAEGGREGKKRPGSSSLDSNELPSRQASVKGSKIGDMDSEKVQCLGVLQAPHKDMTIISCHLSPDLSQTAILFYSLSSITGTFCYTLHCYSNENLQEESGQDSEAHAQTFIQSFKKKTGSGSPDQQTPHLVQTIKLSREVQPYFVYDPRYGASRIAVANYECKDAGIAHELVVLNLGTPDVEKDVEVIKRGKLSLPNLFGNGRFNLLYSKDGELIILQKLTDDRFGVTSFCDIYIFSSNELVLVKYMTASLPGLFHICKVSYEPVFSRCGSYMRVLDHRVPSGSGDGPDDEYVGVQIYQLPRSLSLRSQCRSVILQQLSSDYSIDSLPLPKKLLKYLKFCPIY